jgi:hypothetical protein
VAKAWCVEGWKAGFVPLAATAVLLSGVQPVAAVPRVPSAAPVARDAGLSGILTDLYRGEGSEETTDSLVDLLLERAARDPLSLGAGDLARALAAERAQSSDGSIKGVFGAPIGDLDRDGRSDFVEIRYDLKRASYLYDGKVSFRTYRGVDGRPLWSAAATVTDGFPLTYSAPLGKELGNALIVEELGIVETGGSIATRVTFTTFSDRGARAWSRSFEPEVVVPGARIEDIPLPVRLADVAPGPAIDMLVGRVTLTGPQAGLVHVLVAESSAAVVDGATGDVTEDPSPVTNSSTSPRNADYQGEWIPTPLPAPDVSGDGVRDYLYVASLPGHDGRLTMTSSADGTQLWETDGVPVGWFTDANVDGDLDRDGTGDLLVTTMLHQSPNDASLPHGDLLHAVSGKDGATLWTGTGRNATLAGDVDRAGGADVATSSTFFAPDDAVAGIEYAAFSGSDGDVLYRRRHTLPYDPASSAEMWTFYGGAGDLDADRVEDFFFNQTLQQKEASASASAMVSGRDGRKVFDGLPWVPLRHSLDGSGADVFKSSFDEKRRRLVLTAADVAGGDVIWKAAYAVRSGFADTGSLGGFAPLWAAAGRFSADRCPDVSLVLAGGDAVYLVVLDGRDGSLEWSRPLLGGGAKAFGAAVDVRQRARC